MIRLTKKSAELSGAILAGGQGRRMGCVNKGLVHHHGGYLFEYAVNNLRPHVSKLVIVTNNEAERYQALGYEAIDDGQFKGRGPLAGLYAALSLAETPYVAFAACDQGPLPDEVYPCLLAAAECSETPAAYLSDGENDFPTCAVLSVSLTDSLRISLLNGRYKLMQWCTEMDVVRMVYPKLAFRNFNRPEDLVSG